MEELAQVQQQLGDEIDKLYVNVKKDSRDRKTRQYVEDRLAKLATKWEAFKAKHIEICRFQADNASHPYFTKGYFNQIEKICQKLNELLLKTLEEPKEEEDEQGIRYKRQKAMNQAFIRIINQIEEARVVGHSKAFYQMKMKTLSEYWSNITANHNEIMAHATEVDQMTEYFRNNSYEKLEETYQQAMVYLQECYDNLAMTMAPTPTAAPRREETQKVKLPPIEVPNFNGSYHSWKSFHDLFVQVIHKNESLGKAQKLQYLKANISGEASKLLQHLQVTDANYEAAWELLNHRYNNSRLLLSTQLNTLLTQPPLQSESASGVKRLHDTTKECLLAIQNLKTDTSGWGPIIIHLVTQKLDKESQRLYEQSLESPREVQKLDDLFTFLEKRFQTLEAVTERYKREYGGISANQKNHTFRSQPRKEYLGVKGFHGSVKQHCVVCKGEHEIYTCKQFLGMTAAERMQVVKKENLCVNCLKTGHDQRKCKSWKSCRVCTQKHNTMLHGDQNTKPKTKDWPRASNRTNSERATQGSGKSEGNVVQYQSQIRENPSIRAQVLLATAMIKVVSPTGHAELLRTLIDQGSQASFITEDAAQRLGLPRIKIHANIGGLGTASAGVAKSSVELTIMPRFSSTFMMSTTALVLTKLTRLLPAEQIHWNMPTQLQTMLLADPTYDKPGPIDVILGADVFGKIILDGMVKIDDCNPIAQRTELGWILSGKLANTEQKSKIQITCLVAQSEVETQLTKFWELEEVPTEQKLPKEEAECEQFFKTTVTRAPNGRYTVRIPFNPSVTQPLGSSKEKAMARLLHMEKKFAANKSLAKAYKDFMEEYLTLGHMKRAEPMAENSNQKAFYLPHHAVINQNSSTTKLRVVFDASAKSSTGTSLNDKMYTGPTLQQNLADIIIRWRRHRIAFTTDIEKMYRQIQVAQSDQNYQRILWRNSRQEPIKEYKLTTVTYGTRAAPYLAIKTLQRLAEDDFSKYPEAAKITLRDFYVDDLISGCDTVEEGRQLQTQLLKLMKGGGFNLRKWASNTPELLISIPEKDRSTSPIQFELEDPIKTLGILWNPGSDCFQFKVRLETPAKPYTKRSFLSEASKLYDPLGWMSPTVIQVKIMFQALWTTGLKWDQKLPKEVASKWEEFKEELPALEKVRIPRWIEHDKTSKCELHGFCDASEKAYAAVIYSKIITASGEVKISLLTAKTKVAPVSIPLSLPRLELCGAVLLAKLMKQAKGALEIENVKTYAYTDSTIVLAWLQRPPKKWKTFVANRVGQIQSIIGDEHWQHIRSNENPADCASRGIGPQKLVNHSLWWKGPPLLNEKTRKPDNNKKFSTDLEVRKVTTHMGTVDNRTGNQTEELLGRYSSFLKLIRVMAYCNRFIMRSQGHSGNLGPLTTEELEKAKVRVLKLAQQQEFNQELKKLSQSKQVDKNSKLLSLNPILDKNGLIRVGGRLQKADLSYEAKHPVILPYKGPLTTLIIDMAHKKTLHGGIELTSAYIRNEYWILKEHSAVKQHIHRCTRCYRYRANSTSQLMGDLPAERVTITRPFTNTGVDYAGPINIRVSKGRGQKTYKGYICIFICLATKAIHLEVVSDLTAKAFIAAFKRFSGRRGNISNMYSDNGTNFVLANKILQSDTKAYMEAFNKETYNELAKVGTQWHFIPPASPHFGGLWEAGVKSVKYHMKRIIGEHNLTYEELQTVLIQIEACLNSRPLCPITDDPDNTEVLTPGHFLIGSAIIAPAARDISDKNIHTLTRWQLLERLHQTFWKRWSNEYLSRLQQRPKWTKTNSNMKVGELVLIKDEQLPPSRWALGRIVETHPGTDGIVRVVTVKTKKGTFKRPITKVCSLPISDNTRDAEEENKTEDIDSLFTELEVPTRLTEQSRSELKRKIDTLIKREDGKTQEKARNDYIARYQPTLPQKRTLEENGRTTYKTTRQDNSFTKIHGKCLCLLLLLLCKVGKTTTEELRQPKPFNIIPFIDQPGLFFEELGEVKMETNEWNIIVFFDLSSYWTELNSLKKRIKQLSTFCNAENTDSFNGCIIVIDQLNHQIKDIDHKNDILYQHNGGSSMRQRRSPLNIVGSIAHKLFGVLDEDFATKYEEQIKKVKINENHILELLKNQTSIQEATSNIIKRTRGELVQHLDKVEDQVQVIAASTVNFTTDQKKVDALLFLVSHTMLAISSYQSMQDAILNVVMDTQNGKINPLLLTPDQLKYQLKLIRGNLPEDVTLPGEGKEESTLELYKLISAKTRITKHNVIFDVTIPLFTRTHFQLFHLVPVPTPHNESFVFIKPSTEYLIVNLHRDKYYPITEMELKGCTAKTEAEFICKQQHPIYNSLSNMSRCEMNLLRHEEILSAHCNVYNTPPGRQWIQLHSPNNWIFVMDKEYTLNVICGKTVANLQLKGSGILQVSPGCIVRQSELTINSHYTYTGHIKTSFTPSANLSQHLNNIWNKTNPGVKIPSLPKKRYDDADIAALDKAIELQKEQEKLPEDINTHDVHQYSLISVIFVIIIATASYTMLRKWKSKEVEAPSQEEARETPLRLAHEAHPQPAPRYARTQERNFEVHYSTAGENVD